MTNLNYYKNL